MAQSRYSNTPVFGLNSHYGSSRTTNIIRNAIKTQALTYTVRILTGNERLDTIAGVVYGDAKYWWILAATSDIGWGLQVPPGTVIKVPNLSDVLLLVS